MKHTITNLPMSSSSLREMRDYWLRLRGDNQIPTREALNPADITRLLPKLVLTDVFEDPQRFRYRLIGTQVTALAERDATGKWLDEELYGDDTEDMLWAYKKCVHDKSPLSLREHVQFVDKSWVVVEVLFLPLGNAERTISILLSAVDIVDESVEIPAKGSSFILDWQK